MANNTTDSNLHVICTTVDHPGHTYTRNPLPASADKVNKLLQENHTKFHAFFNYHEITHGIFQHNHLAHHALTLFALGASPELIEKAYTANSGFQRIQPPLVEAVSDQLGDWAVFELSVANEHNYANFLHYFEKYAAKHCIEELVNRFLFRGDQFAEQVFARQFLGFVHPLIHTLAGLEFGQPAIVAEGLAQACVHRDEYLIPIMFEIEKVSAAHCERWTLVDIFAACRASKDLKSSVKYDDFDKLKNGLLLRARQSTIAMAGRWRVEPDEIDLRMAELQNATAFMLAGAQRRGKAPRMDFFTMHGTNCAVFVSALVQKSWVSPVDKARLLSWFGRFSVIAYLVHGAPQLDLTILREMTTVQSPDGWDDAIRRSCAFMDDGHACKMVRSLAWAEQTCRPYEGLDGFCMAGDDFVKAATIVADSLTGDGGRSGPDMDECWIRGAGFDEAWKDVPSVNK
ncbi:hypothetical protein Trihar35433_5275 [Trichoderma harzianum]|nr:hypothetical protein Trihar35433_5275 [Trichoderma harzianum]